MNETLARCQLCDSRGRKTPMLTRYPGAAPICPVCDRKACGHCQTVLIVGSEKRCPSCQRDVSLMRGAS